MRWNKSITRPSCFFFGRWASGSRNVRARKLLHELEAVKLLRIVRGRVAELPDAVCAENVRGHGLPDGGRSQIGGRFQNVSEAGCAGEIEGNGVIGSGSQASDGWNRIVRQRQNCDINILK